MSQNISSENSRPAPEPGEWEYHKHLILSPLSSESDRRTACFALELLYSGYEPAEKVALSEHLFNVLVSNEVAEDSLEAFWRLIFRGTKLSEAFADSVEAALGEGEFSFEELQYAAYASPALKYTAGALQAITRAQQSFEGAEPNLQGKFIKFSKLLLSRLRMGSEEREKPAESEEFVEACKGLSQRLSELGETELAESFDLLVSSEESPDLRQEMFSREEFAEKIKLGHSRTALRKEDVPELQERINYLFERGMSARELLEAALDRSPKLLTLALNVNKLQEFLEQEDPFEGLRHRIGTVFTAALPLGLKFSEQQQGRIDCDLFGSPFDATSGAPLSKLRERVVTELRLLEGIAPVEGLGSLESKQEVSGELLLRKQGHLVDRAIESRKGTGLLLTGPAAMILKDGFEHSLASQLRGQHGAGAVLRVAVLNLELLVLGSMFANLHVPLAKVLRFVELEESIGFKVAGSPFEHEVAFDSVTYSEFADFIFVKVPGQESSVMKKFWA